GGSSRRALPPAGYGLRGLPRPGQGERGAAAMRLLAVPVLLLAFGASPRAQARSRLEARVTAAAGSSGYLGQGREAGVTIGDAVRLLVPGQLPLDVVVQAASRSSARADLPAGSPVVPVGTRAEITV